MKSRNTMALCGAILLTIMGIATFFVVKSNVALLGESNEVDFSDMPLDLEQHFEAAEMVNDVDFDNNEAVVIDEDVVVIDTLPIINGDPDPHEAMTDDPHYAWDEDLDNIEWDDELDNIAWDDNEPEINEGLINTGLIVAFVAVATLAVEPLLLAIMFVFGLKHRNKFTLGRCAGFVATARIVLLVVAGLLVYLGMKDMLGAGTEGFDDEEAEGLPLCFILAIICLGLAFIATIVYGIKYVRLFGALGHRVRKSGHSAIRVAVAVWCLFTLAAIFVTIEMGLNPLPIIVTVLGVVATALMTPYFNNIHKTV